jgi:hypothetical protein
MTTLENAVDVTDIVKSLERIANTMEMFLSKAMDFTNLPPQ